MYEFMTDRGANGVLLVPHQLFGCFKSVTPFIVIFWSVDISSNTSFSSFTDACGSVAGVTTGVAGGSVDVSDDLVVFAGGSDNGL